MKTSLAVWVQADSLLAFLRGKGKIYCRIPVADYGEAELRPKVQSKMTVSTFRAGFAFTVLFAIVASQVKTPGTNISPWELAAVVFLTAAFGFFTHEWIPPSNT